MADCVQAAQGEEPVEAATLVLRSQDAGLMYVHSKTTLLAKPGSSVLRRLALEVLFPILQRNSRQPTAGYKVPLADVVEVGVIRET